jgi:pSer/pThr/pTyr-binding forkhead associated (FHA) protein
MITLMARLSTGEVVPEQSFDQDEVTVGRAPDNDFVLSENGTVSRKHLRIVRQGEHYVAEDMGSACGFWVNGDRPHPMPYVLKDGVVLQIGFAFLRVRIVAPPKVDKKPGSTDD